MKIVFLDGATVASANELDFSGFYQCGEVQVYANLNQAQEILAVLEGVQVVVLNKVVFDAALIASLPASVGLLAICATGYDNVDLAAASARGIKVTNAPGYGTAAVAQLTLLYILNFANQFIAQSSYLSAQGWNRQAGLAIPMHELAGKTLGIIGLGAIGTAVARLALAFGMRVISFTRKPQQNPLAASVPLAVLAAESDFISLHCPLTSTTKGIIDQQFLAHIKPTAYLINTSRGGLVDEHALIKALQQGTLAGAALDVLCQEPPAHDNPLLTHPKVVITPHIAWAPIESRQRCLDLVVQAISCFKRGIAHNLLN